MYGPVHGFQMQASLFWSGSKQNIQKVYEMGSSRAKLAWFFMICFKLLSIYIAAIAEIVHV